MSSKLNGARRSFQRTTEAAAGLLKRVFPGERHQVKTIGLALGGGGARGLAHIPVLELLDEMGIRPHRIAGTSLGALLGALYASGIPGKDIRRLIRKITISKDDTWRDIIQKKELLKWFEMFVPEMGRGGLIKIDRIINYLYQQIRKSTFEELEIPLYVVAADYWNSEEVVFKSGELLPALKASMAVPGVFAPVIIDGRILIDGGAVNNVPYDLLVDESDVTIAVNVGGMRSKRRKEVPGVFDSVLHTFQIMQQVLLAEKMRHRRPDIYVRTDIQDVRMLQFDKADQIFKQTKPAVENLKRELEQIEWTR